MEEARGGAAQALSCRLRGDHELGEIVQLWRFPLRKKEVPAPHQAPGRRSPSGWIAWEKDKDKGLPKTQALLKGAMQKLMCAQPPLL